MTTEPNYTDVLNEKCNEFRQRAANLMTDTKDKKHCAAGQAYLDCAMEFEALLSERQAAMQGRSGGVMPARFLIEKDAWEAAQFAFGGPGTGEGEEFMDCTAWVGDIENDDGSKTHGLHIQCNECPEEGSITLAEFKAIQPPQPVRSVSDEDVESAWAVLRQRDVWPEEWTTNDMRAALEHFAAIAQEKQS